jgi:hypothetical protein
MIFKKSLQSGKALSIYPALMNFWVFVVESKKMCCYDQKLRLLKQSQSKIVTIKIFIIVSIIIPKLFLIFSGWLNHSERSYFLNQRKRWKFIWLFWIQNMAFWFWQRNNLERRLKTINSFSKILIKFNKSQYPLKLAIQTQNIFILISSKCLIELC